ncbi:MAG: abortive infection family protein [Burkholderiales bacterium]|nr:abortive infection family protein [Burkholderiales bacterium]
MNLNHTTLQQLREFINKVIEYRSGHSLVQFFNRLGFSDTYEQGFPSRWKFTDSKLLELNNTPKIKACISLLFSPNNYIGKYDELDSHISKFNEYLDYDGYQITREGKKVIIKSTREENIIENIIFNEKYIHQVWEKTIERNMKGDYDGAITSARSLLESIFKHILDSSSIDYDDKIELPDLYNLVTKQLNLAPGGYHEDIFKQILGGAKSIVNGFAALRNKFGDAHGKKGATLKDYTPKERHSELAMNMAGSLALFYYRTFIENKR